MQNTLDSYKDLVLFLGKALGNHCEIALLDCEKSEIVAISNGHISGRSVGAPITDLAKRIIECEEWKHSDYAVNYSGYTSDGRLLRSSSYFIKHDEHLLGMLCINVDTTDYQQISQMALALGGLTASAPNLIGTAYMEHENFMDNIADTITQVMRERYGDNVPKRFDQEERMEIIFRLSERGVFTVRGSVGRVAKLLGCSEPSVYRYLSKLSKTPRT